MTPPTSPVSPAERPARKRPGPKPQHSVASNLSELHVFLAQRAAQGHGEWFPAYDEFVQAGRSALYWRLSRDHGPVANKLAAGCGLRVLYAGARSVSAR